MHSTENRIELSRWGAMLAMVVALLVGSVGGSIIAAKAGLVAEAAGNGPVFQVASSSQKVDITSMKQGFRPIVDQTLPAVVNIRSTKVVEVSERMSPFFNGPFGDFFGQQFGGNMPREQRQQGEGSGVIVSADGYIVTNNHVVSGASDVEVMLADRREFKAKVIGTDPPTDLAIVKIEATNLPFQTLGDSSQIQVGDVVLAMGNPFGIGQTVTMGIVSALGREGISGGETDSGPSYQNFIQTDAAINPGNSGGALVNMSGELVGINTAIVSRSGGNEGIGFAVPSNLTKFVMEQITANGRVVRGYMGIGIQEVTRSLGEKFNYEGNGGALVRSVEKSGPGAAAGLEVGDIITQINGEKVDNTNQLRLKVSMNKPGSTLDVKVSRNGTMKSVPVKLAEYPDNGSRASGPEPEGSSEQLLAGVQVQDVTPRIASQLGLENDTFGAVVTNVRSGSNAQEAGLQRGDVIQEVNRKRVANADAFEREVRAAGSGDILLLVNRNGNTFFITVAR